MTAPRKLALKEKLLFGISSIPDQLTYQGFQLYVFTFYFAVVKIPTLMMWAGFVIWGIWNMANDPILGALSDRTRCRENWGKRRLYMLIAIIPLCLTMIFLFYIPFSSSMEGLEFGYFLFIIILFEFFYTMFDVNVNALFPEQFVTETQRAETNLFIKGLTVVGIIFASLPTIILTPLVPITGTAEELATIKSNYLLAGILLALITFAFGIPFLLKGIRKESDRNECFEKRPKFFESLKITLSNKTFQKFVIANTFIWYVFNTLITIFPLYFVYVLEIGQGSFVITLALVLALVTAALVLPLHKRLAKKYGTRNAVMLTLALWIVLLVPYLFLNGGDLVLGVIFTAIQGFALSGCLFYVDILHGDVIDEDAIKFGVKRSASYYGINALITRVSTILTISTIALVFQGTSWAGGYTPTAGIDVTIALKLIIMLFPSIGCLIAIISFKFYKLHGENLAKMREELKKHPELQL